MYKMLGSSLRDLVEAEAKPKVLILDCSAIPDMEYTALMALMEWEASGASKVSVWFSLH